MGNGALPHGPSYRAHPRLYLTDDSATSAPTSAIGGLSRKHVLIQSITAHDPKETRGTTLATEGSHSEEEIRLRYHRGAVNSNQADRLSRVPVYRNERVGTDVSDVDATGKVCARYSERGNVEEILATGRIGIETIDGVIAEN
jgi:hypothetical protein